MLNNVSAVHFHQFFSSEQCQYRLICQFLYVECQQQQLLKVNKARSRRRCRQRKGQSPRWAKPRNRPRRCRSQGQCLSWTSQWINQAMFFKSFLFYVMFFKRYGLDVLLRGFNSRFIHYFVTAPIAQWTRQCPVHLEVVGSRLRPDQNFFFIFSFIRYLRTLKNTLNLLPQMEFNLNTDFRKLKQCLHESFEQEAVWLTPGLTNFFALTFDFYLTAMRHNSKPLSCIASFGIIIALLLLMGGIEPNPGPNSNANGAAYSIVTQNSRGLSDRKKATSLFLMRLLFALGRR